MFKNFSSWLVTNWKYLNTAIKLDQEDNEKAKSTGQPLAMPQGNIKNWFKLFGFGTIILITSVFVIWEIIKPRPSYTKSHHGINKYGERY